MTCKDCICYDVCQYHIDEETNMTVEECSTGFKRKDQYAPVYIGQPVWMLFTFREVELLEGKISMIQQKADKSWKFRVSYRSSVQDFTLDEVGKKIFLDKVEADKVFNEKWTKFEMFKEEV